MQIMFMEYAQMKHMDIMHSLKLFHVANAFES